MPISEDTKVRLSIGTIVTLTVLLVGACVRLVLDERELQSNHNRLQYTRNWLYATRYPNEPWSKDWVSRHIWGEENE